MHRHRFPHRWALVAACAAATACGPAEVPEAPDDAVPNGAARATARAADALATDSIAEAMLPTPHDSAALLSALRARATTLARRAASMETVSARVAFGAGAVGAATGWRTGSVWRRIRVESSGERFRTTDDYWFSRGRLMGARLELQRDSLPASVDTVWFMDGQLYRWTDRAGRHLNPESQSTQTEVEMLRARLDAVITTLLNAGATPGP